MIEELGSKIRSMLLMTLSAERLYAWGKSGGQAVDHLSLPRSCHGVRAAEPSYPLRVLSVLLISSSCMMRLIDYLIMLKRVRIMRMNSTKYHGNIKILL